jgi:hypothetical protein
MASFRILGDCTPLREMHNPDVSPGLALLGGRSPVGRHTGSDVVGAEVPSLKGLGGFNDVRSQHSRAGLRL